MGGTDTFGSDSSNAQQQVLQEPDQDYPNRELGTTSIGRYAHSEPAASMPELRRSVSPRSDDDEQLEPLRFATAPKPSQAGNPTSTHPLTRTQPNPYPMSDPIPNKQVMLALTRVPQWLVL